MLADGVETELFGAANVKLQSLVGGGGVKAVGPPTLIQQAEAEDGLVVERYAEGAEIILIHRNLAHCAVALHLVHGFAAVLNGNLEIVEERIVGSPELWLFHLDVDVFARFSLAGGHLALAVKNLDLNLTLAGGGCGIHTEGAQVQIGSDFQLFDMGFVHWLQPDGLPDARHGAVPDAIIVVALFANCVEISIGVVGDLNHNLIFPLLEIFSNILADSGVATYMLADILVVDFDFSNTVYAAAVEQDVLL